MNKNAIKKFAIEARKKLIASVTDKAGMLGISADGIAQPTTKGADFEVYQTVAGTEVTLNRKQCEQRRRLADQVEARGFEAVVEEVAYTWFNRICAIRFMEVNDYLPSRVRALSSEKDGKSEPDLVTQAPDVDLDLTDAEKEYIVEAKMAGKLDELFAMLFIKQCNKLHEILPELFEETSDYTELLLNISYTDKDSIVQMLVNKDNGIPEEDFDVNKSGQVEIIGWLYQYYNEEKKNEVININKGTVKKEDIPAATQLFTTDWVVRYMVDNSLGRYWMERNPESKLRDKLEFFVMPKNGDIEYVDEKIDPTELTFLDPCMGSGHILVYAFDVLMEIYRECGYSDRDAALNIVQFNLYGLDIDDRAYQLAYFAVMMKARSYNRRALTNGVCNNLCAIQESNGINSFLCDGLTKDKQLNHVGQYLLERFKDAKELGSLISVEQKDYKSFIKYLLNIKGEGQIDIFQSEWLQKVYPLSLDLAKQADVLAKKYCVVATNPPYLGKMQGQLKKYVLDNYKDYSGDLFATFMYRNFSFCNRDGYTAYMTPYVWMFIKTYEKLREYIVSTKKISSLIQLEYSAFEEATVPICSFILKNAKPISAGYYIRLTEFKGGMDRQCECVLNALKDNKCGYFYEINQTKFESIDGLPIAYWVSENTFNCFNLERVNRKVYSKAGVVTGDDSLFLRLWHELIFDKINFNEKEYSYSPDIKWVPMNKGGGYRKYYGNYEFVMDIYDLWTDGKTNKSVRRGDIDSYYKEAITWSMVTSSKASFRYSNNKIFGVAAPAIFANKFDWGMLAYLNSNVVEYFNSILNPTINILTGNIMSLPFIESDEEISRLAYENYCLEKEDWDSFENSWDFARHPLIEYRIDLLNNGNSSTISEAYENWKNVSYERFNRVKSNEEILNKKFIAMYNLYDEVSPNVADKDVCIRTANLSRDIRTLISYAVGCMFGRYSLNANGIVYAGGNWNVDKYTKFVPDLDNIIPITDDEYFDDDIVEMFCDWLLVVFGRESLRDNLDFIAKALGNKGDTPKEVIRNYFLKDFMADHIKTYQKRPIYWLFDSGKENGFKALIYMHRYNQDTVGIVRTDYLHRTQKAVEQAMARAEYTVKNASSGVDKAKATKMITKYTKQLAEMKLYDEAMAHIANQRIKIDLDDGVKVNYEKFQGVEVAQEGKKALKIDLLAKIK